MQTDRNALTEGVIWKKLLFFALPILLGNIFQQMYNTADALIVGRFLDEAAVTSSGSLIFMMVGFFNGIAMGAGVVIAKYFGAKDERGVSLAVHTDVAFGLVAGVVLTVLGVAFTPTILRWMKTPENVLPNSIIYFRIYFCGAIFVVMYNIFVGILQAVGDSKHPLFYLICSSLLNVVLDLLFVGGFHWGVWSAALATTISQFVTFFILAWFYLSGRSVIKLRLRSFHPSWKLIKTVTVIGIPTAVIQICLSVASSLTNIAAAPLPDADNIIAAYGVVQRLVLIGCYVVMGFMQGYQPVASFAFGARDEDRFHQSVRFALKASLLLTVLVAVVYILLSRPLILLFNQNPVIVDYGRWLLVSQVALYPAFGLCYMMTITYQTIGASGYGLFLSTIRQGLFYVPFILTLPKLFGVTGIYFSQPAADILTILVCMLSIGSMKRISSASMRGTPKGADEL